MVASPLKRIPLLLLGLEGERKLSAEQLVIGISRDELMEEQKILRVRSKAIFGMGEEGSERE